MQLHEWWYATTKSGKPLKRNGKTEEKKVWEQQLVDAYNQIRVENTI